MRPEEKISVRVAIAGKVLPLRVAPRDEEFVKTAARMLNKRMEDFRAFHAGDETDRLAWAALDFTGDLLRLRAERQDENPVWEQDLQQIEQLLQGY